jgi:rubrerythrin
MSATRPTSRTCGTDDTGGIRVEISTRQLRSMVADVDDAHHDSMRTLQSELEELHVGETGRRIVAARRDFLKKAGAGAALMTVGGVVAPATGVLARAAAAQDDLPFDVIAASYAAGVELAAVAAYDAAAARGLLDAVALQLAVTFQGHHRDHAGTFNGLLMATGQPTVDQPDGGLLSQYGPLLQTAPDALGLLDVALQLEQAAAATYVDSLGSLTLPDAALAVAQIAPVESQHALVLATVLDKPVEERLPAFETTSSSLLED